MTIPIRPRFVILVLLLLSSLCTGLNLREEILERKLATYIIENGSYLPLRQLLSLLESENSWGRIEDRLFIIYGDAEIRFRVEDTSVYVGEERSSFRHPVKEVDGEVLIPVEDFQVLLQALSDRGGLSPDPGEVPGGERMPSVSGTDIEFQRDEGEFIILLDPGHGGYDSGAIGNFGLQEKTVVLDVARRMRDYLRRTLRRYPYVKIEMTRDEDVFVSLEDRVRMSKDMEADIFFSIHANSSLYRTGNANGFETFYPANKQDVSHLPVAVGSEGILEEEEHDRVLLSILEDLNRTTTLEESRILAEFVQERLAERLLTPDRGAKRRNFYVLRYTPMVSVLTEIEFLCNPNVELNLRDAEVRQAIAVALGNSLIDYLEARNVVPPVGR